MIKNTKLIFSIFIIFFVLVSLTSINAISENDTQETFSDSSTLLKNDLNTENRNLKQASTSTHVLNTSSFKEYVTDGKFNEKVSDGDTIDIQGKLDNSKFALDVNKPVNIISSTGDAYIDLNTVSLGTDGDYRNGMFQVTSGSEGTNITGITFHNTRVWVKGTENVHVDNITVLCEQNTGSGVGSFSIRGDSDNITVTNSYFKTIHNGGHSNVVVAGASNCLFENNTVFADAREGYVGNVFYLTTYGGGSNTNITIRNNTIRSVFPNSQGLAICMGLVLEGNGHLIENNRIDALAAVGPQWADADYGVRTDIGNVTFRNNHVTGGAKLIFNGSFYNNTIDHARFTDNIAYNNTIEKHVTILNNTIFENNTVKKITVEGDNNTLNNNEVRSEEDYAVIISGKNNTLTNNKLLSKNAYGEDAVSNSTEYVSVNNSEKLPRIYYVNDTNIEDYFTLDESMTNIKIYYCIPELFDDPVILVLNLTGDYNYGLGPLQIIDLVHFIFDTDQIGDLIVENSSVKHLELKVNSLLTIKNSFLPGSFDSVNHYNNPAGVTLINSTVASAKHVISSENSIILNEYPKDNTYIVYTVPTRNNYFNGQTIFDENGNLLDSVNSSSKVLLYSYNVNNTAGINIAADIYINKPLNFINPPNEYDLNYNNRGNVASNVHMLEGSENTVFDGIIFDGDVIFETQNIKFYNCTFNKDLLVNESFISFDGCTFNAKVTLDSVSNVVFNNSIINSDDSINILNSRNCIFENNNITTSDENTIVFDDDSNNNIVKDNYLVSNSFVGDDSVIVANNIVDDNIPGYDTEIIIDCDSQAFMDEDFEVKISVNDINNKPVSKGYVEIYYYGDLIDIKDLENGMINVKVPIYEHVDETGSYVLKVWYYNGKQYNNNVTTKTIDTVKSNVSITVDEFTAKLNERATTNITFLNQKDNLLLDTNITLSIGPTTYTIETNKGVVSLDELVTTEWLDSGCMTITIPDTNRYNRNVTTITLNTSKADVIITPEVTVEGSTVDIKLTYTDNLEKNVTDGKVSITTLDGTQIANGRVNNGIYTTTVTIPEGYTEEYLIANYTGSYYYNDLARNIKLSAMLNSTITLTTNSPVLGEDLIITGKLTDSNEGNIPDATIEISIDGEKTTTTTDANGEYTYTITPGLGEHTITVTFNGNPDVYGTTETKTITIRDTDHDMNEVLNQLDELTAENARLQEQLNNISEQNNVTQNQLDNLTQQNKDLQDQIAALTQLIAALSAPENTTITLNEITDARYKSDVVISGSLVSRKGLALSGQSVTITVNSDEPVSVVTVNGAFEYTAVFKSLGEQRVSVAYAGSEDYLGSDASISFIVGKQDVVVTVDPIDDVAYGDNVTITGKFTDANGKAISNSNVRIFVNGKKYLARTDKTGAYSLTAKATAVGENNVTVGYGGNDNYNAYEDTITFNADKQDVIVTYNVIEDTKVGENVTITGTFTDKNGKAIINSNVKILINGKKYYAKTDSTGFYTFTTTVTSAGINNVTVGYSGNDKYNSYEDITTFNVEAQDVIVTVNPIEEVAVGDNVTITGTFTDKYGKAIVNSNVKILINGKKYYAKTDSTGAYTFIATVTTEGTNNITAAYSGSAKYNAYETSTTFIAKVE